MALALAGPNADDLYHYLFAHPNGASAQELEMAGWERGMLLKQIQALLNARRLKCIQVESGGLTDWVYQAVDERVAAKYANLDKEHILVLNTIEDRGNQGAWTRYLQDQAKLPAHTIAKITKELVRQGLIKELKQPQTGNRMNRKVFMMKGIEPAVDVTGGEWYQDGVWMGEWIERLRDLCKKFLEYNQGKAVLLRDIHEYVLQHEPRRATEANVKQIMRTLELDEEVYSAGAEGGAMLYTERNQAFDLFGSRRPIGAQHVGNQGRKRKIDGEGGDGAPVLQVPCLACHLRDQCRVGGRICPEKCEYMSAWLKKDVGKGGAGVEELF